MAGGSPCFNCLQRHIETEISADILFLYGVSDSALPFGSAAVVQICLNRGADNGGSEEVSAQFLLTRFVDNDNRSTSEGTIAYDACRKAGEFALAGQSEVDVGLRTDEVAPVLDCNSPCAYLRVIAALAPVTHVTRDSYPTIKDLIYDYMSKSTEDHVISSLNLFTEGKLTEKYSSDFLSFVGFPSFSNSNVPSPARHPNISPTLGIIKAAGCNYLLCPKVPCTLQNILHYSPEALNSDWHIRFLIYQILSPLVYMHGLGIAHGNLCPSSILLNDSYWAWLSITDMHLLSDKFRLKEPNHSSSKVSWCEDDCRCLSIFGELKLSSSIDWHSDFMRWWKGELSNYEYLLVLNRLAGRRWGDHTFHTVMPWVIDFTVKPNENSDTGWRDLKKSKWRLAKGDEQLDFTYQTSDIPHHVSDECLSELAVCSYKARRLPLRILRSAVRSVYEPNEYPSNMQRLYQWTPDECIPEFYSDPQIFFSLHSEMNDLAIPSWAASPEEFISLHRGALESERVSQQIHHWIDITFGYKLSGEASITAKNVMLPVSDPSKARSVGRRQLFTRPHPMRRGIIWRSPVSIHGEECTHSQEQGNKSMLNSTVSPHIGCLLQRRSEDDVLPDTRYMEDLEEAISFCEHARYLTPVYVNRENFVEKHPSLNSQQTDYPNIMIPELIGSASMIPSYLNSGLIEFFDANDNGSVGFQELLHWRQKSSYLGIGSEDLAEDIFSIGCILAEVYLKRPLFDPVSLAAYRESGTLPGSVQDLPPHVAILVKASIQKDWKRRPSCKCLLESQYFPPTVRSAYVFLAPLQLLAKAELRLQYAAKLASEGALKAMGIYAAKMCATFILPLISSPSSNVEAEPALCLLKEFLKCLNPQAIKALILPSIQKILQASECSHLKVAILQDSLVRDLWTRVGKQAYLEKIHPLVLSNLYNSPNKTSASVASIVLIGSSEELGIPITVHQTVLPIIHSFGKGLCIDGIDALVRIGGLLGEKFVVRQLLPIIRNAIFSCIDASRMNKPEPQLSWISLALIDSFSALDGLVSVLPVELVLKEFIHDQICLHVKVLMQLHLGLPVIQIAATTLIALCQRIGPDFTILHVMPQLKDLFEELAFSQEAAYGHGSNRGNLKVSKSKLDGDVKIESRLDLVFLLYPFFQTLIGMEKLRQCCSTWFLLEQILQRFYNWKCDSATESSRSGGDNPAAQGQYFGKKSSLDYNPTRLLLNGAGWSIPQSQRGKGGVSAVNSKQVNELQQSVSTRHPTTCHLEHHEPWFWFPSSDVNCDVPDFLGRSGGLKDELPWKIKALILYSTRAHPGTLRSLAVCHDECTIYTGGVGPGYKGSIQKWELPRMNCISGYYGHDEVVNSICILSTSGRVASCDGTIHVWNGQTGKLIAAHAESSTNFPHHGLPLAAKVTADQSSILTPNVLSSGILANALNDSSYTCMHHLESEDKLVAGMGNGSVRFIDILHDKKQHLWKSDVVEYSFSSVVSAICSCGFQERAVTSPSWIAAGVSSGYCRLLDARCGNIIAAWRGHDGYITKLAAPEDYLLVSSSLDKTLRVWDLRRNLGPQSNIFRGSHQDGISSFTVWGQDVISVSRNKIALTSLSQSTSEGGQHQLSPQKLYSADKGTRNLSVLSAIDVLPFSRLFIVGTEDGYLKVCS